MTKAMKKKTRKIEIEKNCAVIAYDTETTHNKPNGFTQVLSFAAILCDHNFTIIDEFEEVSRLNRFSVIPAAGALLVNNFTPNELKQHQSNYDMTRSVINKLSEWIKRYERVYFIAYNDAFDKSLFRSSMAWNNLLPDKMYIMNTLPASEIDALKLAHCLGSFSSDLQIPISEQTGKKSFRLEGLAKENNIVVPDGEFHTAIYDVRVMVEFIKKFNQTNPDILQSLKNTSHKSKVVQMLNSENNFWVNLAYYGGKEYLYPISFIGSIDSDPNTCVFIDLKHFTEDMLDMSVMDLKKIQSRRTNRVVLERYANKNPILLEDTYYAEKEEYVGIKHSAIQKRHELIQNSKEFKNRIMSIMFDVKSEMQWDNSWNYAEEALYAGFVSAADKKQCEEFHNESDWKNKKKIIKGFHDPRLVELAYNLCFLNAPEVLEENELSKARNRIIGRINDINADKKAPYMTIQNAQDDIDDLRAQFEEANDKKKLDKLEEINQYIEELKEEIETYA